MAKLDKTQLLAKLEALPKESETNYNTEIRKLSLFGTPEDIQNQITLLEEIAFDPKIDDRLAFSAFMINFHHYRRRNKLSQTRSLLARGAPRFKNKKLYQLHQATSGATKDPADFHAAISIARVILAAEPNAPFILNAFAELVTKALEDRILPDDDGALLKEAKQKAEAAMGQAPSYAKYRATFARILLLEGHFDLAKQSIDMAIELEDDSTIDYNIRLANYLALRQLMVQKQHSHRFEADFRQAKIDLTLAIDSMKKDVDESRTKNVEVLAFFSSIIALILTGAQQAINLTASNGQSVLLLLAGVLLLSFSGLSVILYQPIRLLKTLILLAMALAMLGASYFITSRSTRVLERANNPIPAVSPTEQK
jgi:hypothetical protein